MCHCQNCTSEGRFEYENGFIPADCKYAGVGKIEPEVRRWETFEGSTAYSEV